MTEKNYWHISIKKKSYFSPNSFRTITLSKSKGIKALIGCKKGYWKKGKCNIGTEIYSLRFEKNKWTKKEAVEEAKKIKEKNKRKINPIEKIDIKLDTIGNIIGTGYSIEYENNGNIFRHRLEKSKVIAGNKFILIYHPSIKYKKDIGLIGG